MCFTFGLIPISIPPCHSVHLQKFLHLHRCFFRSFRHFRQSQGPGPQQPALNSLKPQGGQEFFEAFAFYALKGEGKGLNTCRILIVLSTSISIIKIVICIQYTKMLQQNPCEKVGSVHVGMVHILQMMNLHCAGSLSLQRDQRGVQFCLCMQNHYQHGSKKWCQQAIDCTTP